MKKRILAVLMAAVLGTCAVPAYADTPETADSAVLEAETDGPVEETDAAEMLPSAEIDTDDETAEAVEDTAPSVDSEITVDEEALEVEEDKPEAVTGDASGISIAENDSVSLDTSEDTEIIGTEGLPTEDAKIATGIYYIKSKLDPTFILGTAGKSDLIRTNIELQKFDESVEQRWVITSRGGGLYSIWNYDSGLSLDVWGNSSEVGANMQTFWRNNAYDGEKFYLLKAKDGSIIIKPKCTKCVVEADGTKAAARVNIHTAVYTGNDNQKFELQKAEGAPIKSGTYVIHTKLDDSKTLYVAGASTKNGGNIEIRDAKRAAASQITVFARSDGTVILSPVNSSMAIEPKDKGAVNRENVQQGTMSTKNTQKWLIQSDGKGYYYIRMSTRNRVLTVQGNNTANGTNVYLWDKANTTNRLFSLERVDGNRVVPNGTYTFTNLKNTNLRMEVQGGSTANRGNIRTANAVDNNRQKFKVAYNSNGYYRISNVTSGKFLHVNTGTAKIGQNIMQYSKKEFDYQYFKLTDFNSTGTYTMLTKLGDYTVGNGNRAWSGANVELAQHRNWLHERWDLTPTTANKTYLVAIDAGHQRNQNTGREPIGPGSSTYKQKVSSGTYGPWSRLNEYELNLQVALKLQKELENRGYRVYMVRTTHDVNISNAERATMAANAGADIFVRIHANCDDYSSSVNGALCYMPSTSNRYLSSSVISGSRKLSKCVIDSYCASTGLRNLGLLEGDDMTGINWAKMPVTIVEMGFMSNRSDDLFMASAAGQTKIVTGIANGIDKYFNS
jgi:N-acetylmuramoyl-L-alanine amidase